MPAIVARYSAEAELKSAARTHVVYSVREGKIVDAKLTASGGEIFSLSATKYRLSPSSFRNALSAYFSAIYFALGACFETLECYRNTVARVVCPVRFNMFTQRTNHFVSFSSSYGESASTVKNPAYPPLHPLLPPLVVVCLPIFLLNVGRLATRNTHKSPPEG